MGGALTFEAAQDGERLDSFLSSRCESVSRSRLKALITDGDVTVDGNAAKPSTKVRRGQVVVLRIPQPRPGALEPQRIPLSIVYEDGDLLVVDKPAGMTVHPAPGHPDGTLVNAVLAHCPDLQGIGGTVRPGIVHRLDKDTSGLMVVAKNDRAHRMLSDSLKAREFTKAYIALVHGRVTPAEAIIDAPIGRSRANRQRMAIVDRRARGDYTLPRNAAIPAPYTRRSTPRDRTHASDSRTLRLSGLSLARRLDLRQVRQQT